MWYEIMSKDFSSSDDILKDVAQWLAYDPAYVVVSWDDVRMLERSSFVVQIPELIYRFSPCIEVLRTVYKFSKDMNGHKIWSDIRMEVTDGEL